MSKIEKIGNQCVKSVKSSNMYLEPSQTFLVGFWLLLLWCFWLLLLWCFWLLLLLLLWCLFRFIVDFERSFHSLVFMNISHIYFT